MKVSEAVCRFFKSIYLFASVTSLLFICLGIGYVEYYNPPALYNFVEQCALIFVDTVLFFLWFMFFRNINKILYHDEIAIKKAQISRNTAALLLIIFLIQFLENCAYVLVPDLTTQRDWSSIHWPDAELGWVEYVFGIYFIFLKQFHYWKDFLLPSTYGIGALVLSMVMYTISKKFLDKES